MTDNEHVRLLEKANRCIQHAQSIMALKSPVLAKLITEISEWLGEHENEYNTSINVTIETGNIHEEVSDLESFAEIFEAILQEEYYQLILNRALQEYRQLEPSPKTLEELNDSSEG